MSVEKAKALLKFGGQAMWAARFEEAEKAFREALDLAKAAKAERLHARALARLVYAVGYQGRMGEVAPLIAHAGLDGVRQGADPVADLILQGSLVQFLEPEKAKSFIEIFVKQAQAHAQDLDVARASTQVALACNAMRDHKLAASLLERAVPVMEAQLGASHPELGLLLHNLAEVRGALDGYKSFDKLESVYRRAIAIQEAGLAPAHPERVMPLATLGLLLGQRSRYAEAQELLERALKIAVEVEGADGGTPQAVRRGLAELEEQLLEPKAEPYLTKVVAALEKEPAAKPLDVALKLTALCRNYFARGKARSAEPHYRKLRDIAARLPEVEQAVLQAEMGVPGKIYALLPEGGDQAEKLLLGQLETMERVLGRGHGEVLRHLYFTGNVYRMLERHKEALKTFERYVEAERKLGENDPGREEGLVRLMDEQLWLGKHKDAAKSAAEIERLTGRKPVMDPALNEFARQLTNVWYALQLEQFPDLIGAALKGDVGAGLVVGLCWAAGQGVARDLDKARPWFERAAEAGHPVGQKIVEAIRGDGFEADFPMIATMAQAWLDDRQEPSRDKKA